MENNKSLSLSDVQNWSSEAPVVHEHRFARALFDNRSETNDELAFIRGDVLTVLSSKRGSGWWLCVNHRTGRTGLSPANRLKSIPFVERKQHFERRKSWNAFPAISTAADQCYAVPRQHTYAIPSSASSSPASTPTPPDVGRRLSGEYAKPAECLYRATTITTSLLDYDSPKSQLTAKQCVETSARFEQQLQSSSATDRRRAATDLLSLARVLADKPYAPLVGRQLRHLVDTDDVTRVAAFVRTHARLLCGEEAEQRPRPLPEVPAHCDSSHDYVCLADDERAETRLYFRQQTRECGRLLREAVDEWRDVIDGQAFQALLNRCKFVVICGQKMAFVAQAVSRDSTAIDCQRLNAQLRRLVAAVRACAGRAPREADVRAALAGVVAAARALANNSLIGY